MKNQYFGDARDFLKYDLLEKLQLQQQLNLDGIAIISMITSYDVIKPNQGNEKIPNTIKKRNECLYDFLIKEHNKRVSEELYPCPEEYRCASNIETYFDKKKISCNFFPYPFIKENRLQYWKKYHEKYFSKVTIWIKDKSIHNNRLIFFDPDNGLQKEKTKNKDKHILYNDLKMCFDVMDDNSIFVVFQYRYQNRKISWEDIYKEKCECKDGLNSKFSYISFYKATDDIAFFIIAKSRESYTEIEKFLKSYSEGQSEKQSQR
jgi:nuclear transport factor 2 (NTF2) superfamily protein